jgi:hypothetical protein
MSNFENSQLKKTLLIIKKGNGKFVLNHYHIVTTKDGENYLRPLPSGVGVVGLAHLGLEFDEVKFVSEPRSNTDGLMNMTHDSMDAMHRLGP